MPATFKDQFAILEELLGEVRRMEAGERRLAKSPPADAYERELRLAGLAQRIAQAYTIIEGLLAFVARRVDRVPLGGDEWRKQLIHRSARPHADPPRPALLSAPLAQELLELCQFRHVVRNIYPTRLEAARVNENLRRLIHTARAFDEEFRAFAALPPVGRRPLSRRRPK